MNIPTLTRRQILAYAATSLAFAKTADPLTGATLYKDLVAYYDLGEHRTATPVDVSTSKWLMAGLKGAGLQARLEPFRTQQFFPKSINLQLAGQEVQSFPMWWPQPTGPKPLTAPLAASGDLKGRIALIKMAETPGTVINPNSRIHQLIQPAVQAGAIAIVALMQSPTGELIELNAQAGPAKWPVPILLVGQRDEARLDAAAKQNTSVSLLLDGEYKSDAEAFETVGELKRGKRLVIVSTPSSGWFHCAGERGPGIALWLALARWAGERKSDTSYIFVASSGHELDGVGIHHFINHVAPKPDQVACWLHLGAGIATYQYKQTPAGFEKQSVASPARRLYSAPPFASALTEAFADLSDLKPIVTDRPGGEMLMMAEKGYPFMGFAGGSVFHHMPGDRPDRITGPELLEPVARDLVKALTAIESRKA